MNLSVRHIKLNELSRVKFITKLAYKKPYKASTIITTSSEPDNLIDSFINKDFFVLGAVLDGKIIGVLRYRKYDDRSLYFYKLAVLKTYRNKGIAASLIKNLELIAKRRKYNRVLLDCAKEKKLPEYYQKLGYKIVKTKKHLDHHDVYMLKTI